MHSAKHTDVLIIGSGLAGATAAIAAAEEGKNVIILTKTNELKSGNTPYAQGGIVYQSNNDTPQKLKQDIITAGHDDCWEEAVDKLCNEGPPLVKKILIDKLNIDFTKKDNKTSYELTAEAAHSEKRILFCKDKTGDSIQTTCQSIVFGGELSSSMLNTPIVVASNWSVFIVNLTVR